MAGSEKKPKVCWDDSRAATLEAKSCTVAAAQGEISLLFGPEQFDQIHFTKRIILNPFTAKQLSLALKRVIGDYEEKFGLLQQRPPASTTARERRLKASSVFELVKGLDVTIGYEQSFKMLEGTMLTDRFLLGVSKKEIAYRSQERIIDICERMNMPQSLMEVFSQCLPDVNYVHFGFEGDRNACLYKVYVEFWDSIREEVQATKSFTRPYILHLGFKWDPFDNDRKTLTRYTWYPRLTGEEMIGRVSEIADPDKHGHVFATARDLIDIALHRMTYRDIIYLEVTEQGNPRKSFDINVYRGGLQVGEIYGLLARLGQRYGLDHAEFHRFYGGIRTNKFGHLSGGISREGRDFCTVYHGVEPIHAGAHRQAPLKQQQPGPAHMGRPPWEDAAADHDTETPVEQSDEQAGRLLDLIKGLKRPFGLERSFKMTPGSFLPGRFLAGFETERDGVDIREQTLGICREIGMPDDLLAAFGEGLPGANIALFGFEKGQGRRLYKAYLEFVDGFRKSVEACPAAPEPFQMFIGFKWDISGPAKKVITRYTCYPAYLLADMRQKAGTLFSGEAGSEPDRALEGILELASHRAGPGEFLYYEAQEAGNERKSFSINLYRAGLRMAEVYPLLLDMARHFRIPVLGLHRTYETAKNMFLGNIAGGTDREGNCFLTLYYSEKGSSRKRPDSRPDEWTGQPGRESGQ